MLAMGADPPATVVLSQVVLSSGLPPVLVALMLVRGPAASWAKTRPDQSSAGLGWLIAVRSPRSTGL